MSGPGHRADAGIRPLKRGPEVQGRAESPAVQREERIELPGEDSNLKNRNQNPVCYHYTTGQQC